MTHFNQAIELVLKHEGGYSNHEKDSGGATKYGISLRLLEGLDLDINKDGEINIKDVFSLSIDEAKKIYQREFWDKHGYDAINSVKVSAKIFDLAVNMGAYQANKIAQNAVNVLEPHKLVIDGLMGKKTYGAINTLLNDDKEELYLKMIKKGAQFFYEKLAQKKPELKVFLQGWLNRVKDDLDNGEAIKER